MTEEHGITQEADTGAAQEVKDTTQVAGKTFTQSELNEIVAKRVAQMKTKYSEFDSNEIKELRSYREQMEEEQLIKKQDFDTVLKKHKEKSDNEVSRLRSELEKIRIDGALINAASKAKSVAPDHVAQLLRAHVKLDESGNAIVVDKDGKARYTDDAEPMTVEQLTEEFLSSNQFFRAAGPSGTGSSGNTTDVKAESVDLNQLDLSKPEHRAIYKQLKAQGKL